MSKENPRRGRNVAVEQALNQIVTDLQHFPTHTVSDHEKLVGRTPETVRQYYKMLIRDGRASETEIGITRNVPPAYQRFWIFVATTYSCDAHKSQAKSTDYQQELADSLAIIIRDDWSERLVLLGLDIILGTNYDLVLELGAKDHDVVHDFVTRVLRTRPYVGGTSTGWARSAARSNGT
jgi:hypothetical protein